MVLRNTLRFLRYNAVLWETAPGANHVSAWTVGFTAWVSPPYLPPPSSHLQVRTERGIDLVRCESLLALDPATRMRVLQRNYAALMSMSPLSRDVRAMSR